MNNETFAKEIEETCYSAQVTKLIWIAASLSYNNELKELFENDWREKEIEEMFPDIPASANFSFDSFVEYIKDYNYFGFIAELQIPVADNFMVNGSKKNHPSGWASSYGHCTVYYIYAETMDELLLKMKDQAKKHFDRNYKKWLKKEAVK